jgi:hypothetical protein
MAAAILGALGVIAKARAPAIAKAGTTAILPMIGVGLGVVGIIMITMAGVLLSQRGGETWEVNIKSIFQNELLLIIIFLGQCQG